MTSSPRRIATAIAALFAALTMTFAVAGCNDDGAESGSNSESGSSSSSGSSSQ